MAGLRNKLFLSMILNVLCFNLLAQANKGVLRGVITDTDNQIIPAATILIQEVNSAVVSNNKGEFEFAALPFKKYQIIAFAFNKSADTVWVDLNQKEKNISIQLKILSTNLDPVVIDGQRKSVFGTTKLNAVDGFGIYEGKKTEVVDLENVDANVSTNNARQVFAKIVGLNIWESDGVGLQLGIGGRGLSPNRSANFNVRQNGYDISADALGYPESYYTPPIEALERIEIVRGAASLQYGTQFGGMVNFKFKEGAADKKIEVLSRQTLGSWGFLNSFNSIGGTVAKGKINYYSYFQYKKGDGFRENSGFNYHNFFANINYTPHPKVKLSLDYTNMAYVAQQPGGLTDKNFEEDIRKSFRSRNWFDVHWNLLSFSATYQITPKSKINSRTFALMANRRALGNLERIHVADFGGNRTLIEGEFNNIGNETRWMQDYTIGKQKQVFLTGVRIYQGFSTGKQGDANSGSGADFVYLNPENLENSNYIFPSKNYSWFAENIIRLNDRFSLTPGVRYEFIQTESKGYYKQRVFDGAGNLIVDNRIDEYDKRTRDFLIFGLGSSYKFAKQMELYANFSQNYKAINFSDLRIVNPNFIIDENIQDETGYTADLGLRGKLNEYFNFEITAFLLKYNGKIGQVLRADLPPLFNDYRFRGNISDARNIGVEFFGEFNLLKALKSSYNKDYKWNVYTNFSFVDARYINTQDNSILNKKVEMVPPVILRSGTSFKYKNYRGSIQHSFVNQHFSDASNAIRTATAVEGIIPSYNVMDISLAYSYKKITIEGSINNVLNEKYFTRRAEGYPGPGILPSDMRSFFLTLQVKL